MSKENWCFITRGQRKVMTRRYLNVPLNPLRAFAVASQHKTFTAAAQQMGVTQVAISRQIGILEDYLDIQLFERGARSVKLTEHGRAFSLEIAPLFDGIAAATNRLLSSEREQVVDLRIYPTFAHHLLMPELPSFLDAYPDYNVRLDTHVEPLDFRSTHVDVAVQLGSGNWRDAKSRILFSERLDAVCSPEYAKKLEAGDVDIRLLHSKYRRRAWEIWTAWSGVSVPFEKELEFESSSLTYSAAISGMGLAIGQIDILRRELEAGLLVTPFASPQVTGSSFYVIWPMIKSTAPQTKRLINWLLTVNGQNPEFIKYRL
jgi:LysR family glycine cleavage system transcriptional activator